MILLDTGMAAYMLGLTTRRVQQLVQSGTLTNHGTTRQLRLDVDEVSDFAYSVKQCSDMGPKA